MKPYDHKKIEPKWQRAWKKSGIYRTRESSDKPKFYVLDMFPYPSGEGLHVGHPKGYIATDVISRMKRMQGHSVLHPMGFDAFGLPAENYAIKTRTNPMIAVAKNVARYKKQLEIIGFDYDWSREVNTTDPKYYKWTQWIFSKLYERGLAYQSYEPINWCPSCKTGLANEDVEDGRCERCGTPVEKKPMRQWVLKITDYADRLLADLDTLDWPEHIKESQRNWIGRSEGAEIEFELKTQNSKLKTQKLRVFTTRPDTLFGVTYVVLAPEHAFVTELLKGVKNKEEVVKYVAHARMMTQIERTDAKKEKTGVKLDGVMAVNPANGEEIPVWVADYVLVDYGTGAVMAVPAHDDRDFVFSKKYNLPIEMVVRCEDHILSAFTDDGVLMNSGPFDGMSSAEARKKITEYVKGKWVVKYKLKDWVFSRQRYWGEPFPILHGLKAKKALLIHGFEGDGTGHWFKKMKKALEDRGVEVFNPTIFTSDHPTIESWMNELVPIVRDFGPDDLIIGHSLGGNASIRLVERVGRSIGRLFLVASAVGKVRSEDDWKKLSESMPDSDTSSLRQFWQAPIDWNRVSKYAPNAILIKSKDDHIIPPHSYNLPDFWQVEEWDGFGHFDSVKGTEFDVLWRRLEEFMPTETVVVPEKDLPVVLPKVKSYEPSGTGESPLATIDKWVNVKLKTQNSKFKILKRETNTMPQWAGSSWYYLRYMDPKNNKRLVDPKREKYWNQVDFYVGGAEHATRHLIYARFWHKFLYDIGVVSTAEPFAKLQSVGLIMGEDGKKMSKRFNNVVNPDDIVDRYGADTLRIYEMFMGPFDQAINWSTDSMIGSRRFIERVWKLQDRVDDIANESKSTIYLIHQTIIKVTDDISTIRLNTAVSALMTLTNALEREPSITRTTYEILLRLLAPFTPHVTEEIWKILGNKRSIHLTSWPSADHTLVRRDEVTIVVQVNGKMRGQYIAPYGASNEELEAKARAVAGIDKWIGGKNVARVIVVQNKLVNFVVKES